MCILAQAQEPLRFESVPGLSQNTVYSIMKDKQGFLWMGTADGLNRYDGVQMKIYKPDADNKKRSFQDRIIRYRLVEDEAEKIWFSTGTELYSFNKNKDVFESHYISWKKGEPTWPMEPMLVDGSHLWGANGTWGVFDYNYLTREFVSYGISSSPSNNSAFVKSLKDNHNNFWFIVKQGILFFDRNKKKWINLFRDKNIIGLGYSTDTVYLSTADQLLACDTRTFQIKKIEVKQKQAGPFRIFHTDKKNNVWAGDESGNIFCKLSYSSFFEWRGNINGENLTGSLYPVYSIYVDDNEILWVGADVLGLQKASLKKQPFNFFPVPTNDNKNNSLFIHTVLEDEKEYVWLGTYRQGLFVLNKKTGLSEKIDLPIKSPLNPDNNSVSLICTDSHGNLWIGAYYKLFVRKKGQSEFKNIPMPPPDGFYAHGIRPYAMTEYKDSLFFATAWGIYTVFPSGNDYTAHYRKTGAGFFYDIYLDPYKNFWLAVENGIIRKKDLDRPIEANDTALFRGTGIKSFLPDSSILWISTTDGLIAWHLPTNKYKIFSEADGLANNYVYGALKSGNVLWISTNKGLSKAIIKFKRENVLPDLSFTNFTKQDGLPDNEFNTGAFYKGSSGDLYFGTIKGVVWFKAGEMKTNQNLPKIVMTNLLINEKTADSSIASEYIQHLSLSYFKNSIFFNFRGIEFTNPVAVTYAYKLEAWDKDWIYSGTLNQVRYNNLLPGKYVFKVKAANGSGIWNEKFYSVFVTIHPPFWETWWFIAMLVIVLIGAVIVLTRSIAQRKLKRQLAEMEKQREIDRERIRISREMHDDIGAGLTQITLMSESVKSKPGFRGNKELEDISGTSRKLVNSMSEIIWSLSPENKTLDQLCAYMREQLNKQLEYSGMNYKIDLPENGREIMLSNEQRRNILLVTKEIVNNAIKYSSANTISIQAEVKNNSLAFIVEDDGKGFEIDKIYRGNGLKNIRTRIEELGGKMELVSEPGKGSRFKYSISV